MHWAAECGISYRHRRWHNTRLVIAGHQTVNTSIIDKYVKKLKYVTWCS